MILCVGAASARVIEEAAKLRVHQIVASRRQVGEFEPGYTGFTSETLVQRVKALSGGETNVVRDHGGPYQNGSTDDDWVAALDADVSAGFHGLHLDVCHLTRDKQPEELTRLCARYKDKAFIEIGGERDNQTWLSLLLSVALDVCKPSAAVADIGGHIWADRQKGHLIPLEQAKGLTRHYASQGVVLKAHNMDWIGGRAEYGLHALYNVAPEFGNVEVDAWLHTLTHTDVTYVLEKAYASGLWTRWFNDGEGTRFERSRAALRYLLEEPEILWVLADYDDSYVREAIRDAIERG